MMIVSFLTLRLLMLKKVLCQNCGNTLFTDLTGQVSSPSYPANYPPNTDCVFTISAEGREAQAAVKKEIQGYRNAVKLSRF